MKIERKAGIKISQDNTFADVYDSQILDDDFVITNYNINNNIIIFFPNAFERIALALYLIDSKYKVYSTFSRNIDFRSLPREIIWYEVNDENSLLQTVEFIKEKEGKIDVLLLHNSDSFEFIKYDLRNNILNEQKIVNAVLPAMHNLQKGKIIFLNSDLEIALQYKIALKYKNTDNEKLNYFKNLALKNKKFNINVYFINYFKKRRKNYDEEIKKIIIKIVNDREKRFFISVGFELKFWQTLNFILPQKIFHIIWKRRMKNFSDK